MLLNNRVEVCISPTLSTPGYIVIVCVYPPQCDRLVRNRDAMDEGRAEEAQALVLRLLSRCFSIISPATGVQIRGLSLNQVEDLGEALLDFSGLDDLEAWLRSRSVDGRKSQTISTIKSQS